MNLDENFLCVSRSIALLCLTLCNSMDCGPPGSFIHGIIQARILEWVAISSSRDLPDPRIDSGSTTSPALTGGFFTCEPGKPVHTLLCVYIK